MLICAGLAHVRADDPPTYVGAQTCAGCHAAETDAWKALASRAGHAACHRGNRAGRFFRRSARALRRHDHILSCGRPVHGADRWPGRQAARISDRLYVRRPAAAAVSDRIPERTLSGARHRLGQPSRRSGRAPLVSSLPRSEAGRRRAAALDRPRPDLELHVRRLSFDQPAQELRPGWQCLRDDVLRHECRLRGLPRPRLPPHRMGTVEAGRLAAAGRGQGRTCRLARCHGSRHLGDERTDRHRQTDGGAAFRRRAGCLRRVPHQAKGDRRGRHRGHTAARPLDAGAARARAVPRRWADRRRSVRGRLIHAEPDVRCRRHLHQLPRPACRRTARIRERSLRPVPHAAKIRCDGASPSCAGKLRRAVRGVPHAGEDLHGRRPAARSQLPGAASGPDGDARRSQHMQCVPCGQVAGMGGEHGGRLVSARQTDHAALRHRAARRTRGCDPMRKRSWTR